MKTKAKKELESMTGFQADNFRENEINKSQLGKVSGGTTCATNTAEGCMVSDTITEGTGINSSDITVGGFMKR
jgi:hypothetical protein